MSDRNFSRRRRGMRFRPSGGLGHGQQHSDREAIQARAEAVGGPPAPEKVYEHRHAHEIERAENIAAGLPPEGLPRETARSARPRQGRFPRAQPGNPRASAGGKALCARAHQGTVPGHRGNHPGRGDHAGQESPAADQAGQEDPQGSHHQRRNARNPRGRVRGRPARGIHHRADHRRAAGRQHLQRQGAQPRRRPQSRLRGYRLREERLSPLLGHRAEQFRQRSGNRRSRRPAARPAQDHPEGHPAPLPARAARSSRR